MIIVVNFFYLHPSDCEWRVETDCHSKHHSVTLSLQCLLQGAGAPLAFAVPGATVHCIFLTTREDPDVLRGWLCS
jgi:hypothetical protein